MIEMKSMMVPKQTKITMTVWEDLFNAFNKKLDGCFIKRDAFLNHIIYRELDTLQRGLKGRKNSPEARRLVTSELSQLGTKKINVVVDKEVAEKLNKIVKDHNLARDAFINRLLLLLTFPDKTLAEMFSVNLNPEAIDVHGTDLEMRPKGFGEALPNLFNDPNSFLQEELEINAAEYDTDPEGNIYTSELKRVGIKGIDKTGRFLIGLSCYLDDSRVPNTDAWKKRQEELKQELKDLEDFDLDFLTIPTLDKDDKTGEG